MKFVKILILCICFEILYAEGKQITDSPKLDDKSKKGIKQKEITDFI